MDHTIVDLFPRPIIKTKINIDGIVDIFHKVIKVNGKNNITQNSHEGLLHYHNDSNVFEIYDELKEFGNEIHKTANFVYQNILNHQNTVSITNAWFNECELGGFQFMHNHCNAVLCGTLYLVADQNTCIDFQSPFGLSETSSTLFDKPSHRQNEFGYYYHSDMTTFNVVQGDCLFWQSYIKHGYPPNKTPNRLSLSFNLMPDKVNSYYKI